MDKEFTVIEAEGAIVDSFDDREEAVECAREWAEENDCDCHVSNSNGSVEACFGR